MISGRLIFLPMWSRVFAMLALLALALMPMVSVTPAFAAEAMSAMHCQDVGKDLDGGSLSQSGPQSAPDISHRACAIACSMTCSMILSLPAATFASVQIQSDMVVAPLVAALDDGPLAVEPPPPR